MLTKETMDKFLDWMKHHSNEECKDQLAYGVRAGVNSSGYLMQAVTIFHGLEMGNYNLWKDDLFFKVLKEFFKEKKLNYYIMTEGAFYSEIYVYDPANSGFFDLQGDPHDMVDDEFTFASDATLEEVSYSLRWNTKYGNLNYMPENLDRFTEVAR